MRVRSLDHPDLRPSRVHSMEVSRMTPSDFTGNIIRSLSSPTFRHLLGGRCFCFRFHHHQIKKTAVPAPTANAVTYASLDLSKITTLTINQNFF